MTARSETARERFESGLSRPVPISKKVILIVLVVVILIAVVGVLVLIQPASPFAGLKVITVRSIFLDVNGDGLVDYVPYLQAIINGGNKPVNFTYPAPAEP